jgi:hypothetical protein
MTGHEQNLPKWKASVEGPKVKQRELDYIYLATTHKPVLSALPAASIRLERRSIPHLTCCARSAQDICSLVAKVTSDASIVLGV